MKNYTLLLLTLISFTGYTQSIDIESVGKAKPIKVSGVISANGVYYTSNQNNNREPFTYFLRGNLNISIYGFAIPISYSFTNQGDNLDYALPFNFNRISLHPKYKWATAHIGNVAMTFSPYTLNGHQFTGGGVDLAPSGAFKISAMAGQLLKATPNDEDERTVPAFQRMGYGLKTSFEKERFKVGIIGFYAKDNINSIDSVPEAKGVLPKENLVISLNTQVKITKEFTLDVEYASTAITQDLRAPESDDGSTGLTASLFSNRASTEFYNALRTNLTYNIGRTNLGIGYERIDPGYETLGAYYFNNDFENITLNTASSFFKDKLTLAMNIGYQRDDLDNIKANATNRFVGAANVGYTVSDRLSFTGSYSNFQTYTNIKPNQFDVINDDNLLDNEIENLDYKQLSQNATFGINYVLSQKKESTQNIAFNYALNDVANEQGGIVRIGDASTFHNTATNYTIAFPDKSLDLNAGINFTYNTIGTEDATTWGPNLGIGKRFFEKTLGTRLGLSYNESQSTSGKTQVANIRLNINYVLLERHNFSASAIQLFRSTATTTSLSELTATFGYNYSFGIKKPNFKRKENAWLSFSYRKYTFEGLPWEITPQLNTVAKEKQANEMVEHKKDELKLLARAVKKSEDEHKKVYKDAALAYLKALFFYEEFLDKYDEWIYNAYLKLIQEGEQLNSEIQQEYLYLKAQVNTYNKPEDIVALEFIEKKFNAHTDMLHSIKKWNLTQEEIREPEGNLKKLKKQYLKKIYAMYVNERPEDKIINYIEVRLADLYHKVLQE
ncbi:hypothetical protein [Aquimarina sp. I32.4]|uniref:hypothetical protein n=1 Tax=Aquimarina sp. I32.4 TaxID=2053903 RepID=UPI000CDE7E70|nr:hypothetical protein [Aquimarina sp. I32.4]